MHLCKCTCIYPLHLTSLYTPVNYSPGSWYTPRLQYILIRNHKLAVLRSNLAHRCILFSYMILRFFCLFLFLFWSHCAARGILVPGPGIKTALLAVKAQCLNHWATREVPYIFFLLFSQQYLEFRRTYILKNLDFQHRLKSWNF